MASATHAVLLLAATLVLASPVAMRGAAAAGAASSSNATGCGAEKFPAGKSYANCSELAPLGATLYWTYDAANATLSVAFVAKPTGAGGAGWVAWAVNPTGDGMKGAQALVAFKPAGPGSPYVVRTYNLTGYGKLPANSTPIAFKATDLAADESAGGKVRLYGKLQLKPSMKVVNHIWQVGATVNNSAPAKHAFAKENLDAKGKLALVAGAEAPAPAPAASSSPSSPAKAGGGTPAPSGGKKSAATASTYVSAPVLAVLALVGLLAIV